MKRVTANATFTEKGKLLFKDERKSQEVVFQVLKMRDSKLGSMKIGGKTVRTDPLPRAMELASPKAKK